MLPRGSRSVYWTSPLHRAHEDSITAGRFANAGEAIRAGLSLLERDGQEREAKLTALRAAIDHGDGSGLAPAGSFDRARAAITAIRQT